MTMDISNFYLMTPLKRPEYVRINIRDIPDEIVQEYKLTEKAETNGSVYVQANRGMYGLPQSGLLANELLEKRLNKQGYYQSKLVPGLWKHTWRPVQFTLVVDDFGVKYVGEEHALHLKKTLEEDYTITLEWKGTTYADINIAWEYNNRNFRLSMECHIKNIPSKDDHCTPFEPQVSPHKQAHKIWCQSPTLRHPRYQPAPQRCQHQARTRHVLLRTKLS